MPNAPASDVKKRMKTARTMIEGYNAIGYQAYNVSSQDFAAGRIFLKELQQIAKFPFISANILDSLTRQPIFKPYIIEKVSKKKFGIIGITSKPAKMIPGIEIASPDSTLEKIIPELRKKVDYIIVLANLDRIAEKDFFEKTFDIDFVLISGSYRYSKNLEDKNSMIVAYCGSIGKYMGIIRFDLQNPDVKLTDVSRAEAQLSYARKRLDSFTEAAKGKPVEIFYANQPSLLSTIKSLKTQIQILTDENARVANPVFYDLIALDETIPDDQQIRAKLNELEQKLNSARNRR
ncbi:hypothetical protein KJ656_02700 [bacterium]|nr:hypothetical protein [bacterium]